MNYKTVVAHAKRLGCFKINQSGKGRRKNAGSRRIPLAEIFTGKVKTFQSHKLRKRLILEGWKDARCENCQLSSWQNHTIPLELHHKDGNRYNNTLANLALLCPNCHALTDNFRARNRKNLSARLETSGAEPLKIGEASQSGNPEPSPEISGKV